MHACTMGKMIASNDFIASTAAADIVEDRDCECEGFNLGLRAG